MAGNNLFQRAQQCIPGGVNSPVRAYGAVGGEPPFIRSAQGAYLFDESGERYIDYVCSWGAVITQHADPRLVEVLQEAVTRGTGFGAPTQIEVEMAERLQRLLPSLERVRMVNSGTEATMTAIRLARGFTGRDKFIKFEGCYHGHADSLLVKAGSGAATFGQSSSAGVPQDLAQHTLVADFNNLDSVVRYFETYPDSIAAIIVEPIAGNMNCILPKEGFLSDLRAVCDQYGALLIFDEVMTGFRVALGGAQALFDIQPDLTTLGKVIGGGLPVGALGGRQDVMEYLAPLGPVYQAGTLSGNPIAMAAGLANLQQITDDLTFYDRLQKASARWVNGLRERAGAAGIPMAVQAIGGMFGFVFTDVETVSSYQQVAASDTAQFNRFFHGMLKAGVNLAPSSFEAGFVSAAHTDEVIDASLMAAESVFETEFSTA